MKVKTNLRAGSGANAGGVNAGGANAGGGSANTGGVNGHNSSENNTVVSYTPPVVASRCVGL